MHAIAGMLPEYLGDVIVQLSDVDRDGVIGVVVGCKSDLSEARQVSKEEGLELAVRYNARYFEASSRTGERIPEMFEGLATSMLSRHLGWTQDPRLKPKFISTRSVRERVSTINTATARRANSRASSFLARSRSLRNSFRIRHRSSKKSSRKLKRGEAVDISEAASSEAVEVTYTVEDTTGNPTEEEQVDERHTIVKKLLCCSVA